MVYIQTCVVGLHSGYTNFHNFSPSIDLVFSLLFLDLMDFSAIIEYVDVRHYSNATTLFIIFFRNCIFLSLLIEI